MNTDETPTGDVRPSRRRFNHIATLYEAIAAQIPESPAVVAGTHTQSWQNFDFRASKLATFLTQAGLVAGDVIAQMMTNRPEYLEIVYGSLKMRAVPSNINYRYKSNELVHLLRHTGARVLFVDDDYYESARASANEAGTELVVKTSDLNDLLAPCEPAAPIERNTEDIFLTYTGGTTGLPRGVEYRLGDMVTNALASRHLVTDLIPTDEVDPVQSAADLVAAGAAPISIPASPLMHTSALVMTALPTLSAGGTVVLMDAPFEPAPLLEEIAVRSATSVGWVGNAFARPVAAALVAADEAGKPYDVSSIRSILSAGLAWDADVKRTLLQYLDEDAVLVDSCGSSEGGFIGTRRFKRGDKLDSAGFDPAPGLKLMLDTGEELSAGDPRPGLITVPTIASGYRNDPAATALRFRKYKGRQYVTPGDWGRIDDDGTLILIGRGSGVVNTGGEKVFAEEVEQVVRQHPDVVDCLVIGTPDARLGQVVTALVATERDVTDESIAAVVRSHLAGYKVPRRIVRVQSIPRGPHGKPDYAEATRLAASETTAIPARHR